MVGIVKLHKEGDFNEEIKPNFYGVRPRDQNELILDVLHNKHRFHKNIFFQNLSTKIWRDFYEHMKKRIYRTGDIIYERG